MRSPAPRPAHRSFADPSSNILGSKLCTGATFYSNLLILLFLSLLIVLFLYIKICLLCKYILIPEKSLFEEKYFYFLAGKTHIRHSEGFFVGTKPFLIHLGSKCIYRCDNLILLFISLLILLFLSLLTLLVQ
jgi:hypothetical protein